MLKVDPQLLLSLPPSIQVAIFSHFLRRTSDEPSVSGVLMGHKSDFGGEINVRNCYPFTPKSPTNVKSFVDLHRKLHAKDAVLGWYVLETEDRPLTTDPAVRTVVFQEFFLSSAIELRITLSDEAFSTRATIFHTQQAGAVATGLISVSTDQNLSSQQQLICDVLQQRLGCESQNFILSSQGSCDLSRLSENQRTLLAASEDLQHSNLK